MSRNMGKNTISPEQDFSDWNALRLLKYSENLGQVKGGIDRNIKKKVDGILNHKGFGGIMKRDIPTGEYSKLFDATIAILELAVNQGVLKKEEIEVLIFDLNNAENAWKVSEIQKILTRLLYIKAIDYSDILRKFGIIDGKNYQELHKNISYGPDWTKRDLEIADQVDRASINGDFETIHAGLDEIIKFEVEKNLKGIGDRAA